MKKVNLVKNPYVLAAVIILVVAFLGLFIHFKGGYFTKIEQPQAADEVRPKRAFSVFDWQFGEGDLSAAIRPNVSERLLEIFPDGMVMNRLATSVHVDVESHVTKVEIRDGVYWSDGTQLIADHVVAAIARAQTELRRLPDSPLVKENPWLRKVHAESKGKFAIEISGTEDAVFVNKMLASHLVSPIFRVAGGDPLASEFRWDVVLGKYAPTDATDPSAVKVTLRPNLYYYRGIAKEAITLPAGTP
jgi:ABC-type transport system substrate-binding protein